MSINIRKIGEVADGAITTAKLADNAVTTAKAIAALRRNVFVGDETEVSVTGTTETEVKTFNIICKSSILEWLGLHVQAEMKTNNALYTATMRIYVDSEVSARITLNSTGTDYGLESGKADISDLATGRHIVRVKMVSSDAAGTAYNDLIEIFTEI